MDERELMDRMERMQAELVELRMEVERLRDVADEEDLDEDEAEPFTLVSGPGAQVSRSGNVYEVSADDPEPMPFDARWTGSVWEAWLPSFAVVTRNGQSLSNPDLSATGWVNTGIATSALYVEVLKDPAGALTHWWDGPGAVWRFYGSRREAQYTPRLLAVRTGTGDSVEVTQLYHGVVSTFWALPDSQYGVGTLQRSVDWNQHDPGVTQVFDFAEGPTFSTDYWSNTLTHLVARQKETSGAGTIRYLKMLDLVVYLKEQIDVYYPPDTDPYDLNDWPCESSADGSVIVWDPCAGAFVRKTFFDADDYEEQTLEYKDHDGVNQTMTVLARIEDGSGS